VVNLDSFSAVGSLLCWTYWFFYFLRDSAVRRVPSGLRPSEKTEGDITVVFDNAPRLYFRRLQKSSPARNTKVIGRWITAFIVSSRYVHWSSPLMVVVFPVYYAIAMYGESSVTWDIIFALNSVLWTALAWREVKKDGPRWKKRLRSLSKVVQTSGGRLAVVPNKA
jgi:hypothetical protein